MSADQEGSGHRESETSPEVERQRRFTAKDRGTKITKIAEIAKKVKIEQQRL